jgi:putative ABC transport system substrate-binding protein
MRRRTLLTLMIAGALLASGPSATAQAPAAPARVGILATGLPRSAPLWQAFDKRMRELGWVDGQNLHVEFRNAEGKVERLPTLAADLADRVDLIVAPGSDFTLRAAKQVAGTRPIVIIAIDYDPLSLGLIDSLARPGGNVTGVFLRLQELAPKQLALIKEAIPRAKRIAVLWAAISADLSPLKAARQAAPSLKLELRDLELRGPPYDFDGALREAARAGVDAALVMAGPLAFQHRAQIAQFALTHRIPTIFGVAEYAEAGGFMSYGADVIDMQRRAAEYVDRILRGAKAADLPVEQPDKFQLVLNMKTARSLKLTVPMSIRLRADRVIE